MCDLPGHVLHGAQKRRPRSIPAAMDMTFDRTGGGKSYGAKQIACTCSQLYFTWRMLARTAPNRLDIGGSASFVNAYHYPIVHRIHIENIISGDVRSASRVMISSCSKVVSDEHLPRFQSPADTANGDTTTPMYNRKSFMVSQFTLCLCRTALVVGPTLLSRSSKCSSFRAAQRHQATVTSPHNALCCECDSSSTFVHDTFSKHVLCMYRVSPSLQRGQPRLRITCLAGSLNIPRLVLESGMICHDALNASPTCH
jgi:hypothetical protein